MSNQASPDQPWHEGIDVPSPVREVLALGYYDGPTDGLLRCADGCIYRFDLLTWEPDTQDLRVFSLSRLPTSAWHLLISLYAPQQTPRWPVWVPSWREELDQKIADILRQAGPVEWIIAAENMFGEIQRVKAIHDDKLAAITNWQAFLGLDRELPARFSPFEE